MPEFNNVRSYLLARLSYMFQYAADAHVFGSGWYVCRIGWNTHLAQNEL
jgi:hypothetical protein